MGNSPALASLRPAVLIGTAEPLQLCLSHWPEFMHTVGMMPTASGGEAAVGRIVSRAASHPSGPRPRAI